MTKKSRYGFPIRNQPQEENIAAPIQHNATVDDQSLVDQAFDKARELDDAIQDILADFLISQAFLGFAITFIDDPDRTKYPKWIVGRDEDEDELLIRLELREHGQLDLLGHYYLIYSGISTYVSPESREQPLRQLGEVVGALTHIGCNVVFMDPPDSSPDLFTDRSGGWT